MTPENNGFVKWLEVVGTGNGFFTPIVRVETLRALGVKEMPAGSKVWERYGDYLKRTKGMSDTQAEKAMDDFEAVFLVPWAAADHPDMAGYLKTEEGFLTLAAESASRPKWWLPMVSADGRTMIMICLPSLATFRDMARVLSARAVLRGVAGDIEGCLSDVKTIRQLARKVGSGATLIERLVGVAMDALGTRALATVVASGKLTEAQCRQARASLDALGPMPQMLEGMDVGERWTQLDNVQWVAAGQIEAVIAGFKPGADLIPTLKVLNDINREQVQWDVVLKRMGQLMDLQVEAAREPNMEGFRTSRRIAENASISLSQQDEKAAKDLKRQPNEAPEAYTERITNRLVNDFFPSVWKSEELYRRDREQVAMARVVLAAAEVNAKTGKWPVRQEELAPGVLKELPRDMYSEGGALPFRYVVKEKGVRVYSVGENGKDDGGVSDGKGKDDLGVGVE